MDVAFLAGVKYKNKVFFSAMNVNALMTFDCKTQETKYLKSFEKEDIKNCLHRCAFLHGDTAWFIPWEGHYLVKVNLDSLDMDYYLVPQYRKFGFIETILYMGDYLFLIPNGNDMKSLLRIDLTNSIVENCGKVLQEDSICAGAYIWNDRIHFVGGSGEVCSTYCLSNGEIIFYGKGGLSGYHSLLRTGDNIVLIPWEANDIKIVDVRNSRCIDSITIDGDFDLGIITNNRIGIFPFDRNRNMISIILSGEKVIYERKKIESKIDKGRWLHLREIPSDDKEKWITSTFGEIYRVDDNLNTIERYILKIEKIEEEKIIKDAIVEESLIRWLSNGFISEGSGLASLSFFLMSI